MKKRRDCRFVLRNNASSMVRCLWWYGTTPFCWMSLLLLYKMMCMEAKKFIFDIINRQVQGSLLVCTEIKSNRSRRGFQRLLRRKSTIGWKAPRQDHHVRGVWILYRGSINPTKELAKPITQFVFSIAMTVYKKRVDDTESKEASKRWTTVQLSRSRLFCFWILNNI